MSIEEVCTALGCKRAQVFRLLAKGILERAPRYGRSLRIYRASVDKALQPKSSGRKRRRVISRAGFELSEIPL